MPRTDLIQSMVIFGCTEQSRNPSIEFIQWEDRFLMVVNSANFIGSFKSFVEKEIVFDIFGIEV